MSDPKAEDWLGIAAESGRTSYTGSRSMPPRTARADFASEVIVDACQAAAQADQQVGQPSWNGAMPAAFGVPAGFSHKTFWQDVRDQLNADHEAASAEAWREAGIRAARVGARRLERRVLRDAWWQTRFADLAERRRAA